MTSIKTTLGGIGMILVAVGAAIKAFVDNDPATNVDWTTLGVALAGGWALIQGRDNTTSDEDAGAKTTPTTPP